MRVILAAFALLAAFGFLALLAADVAANLGAFG